MEKREINVYIVDDRPYNCDDFFHRLVETAIKYATKNENCLIKFIFLVPLLAERQESIFNAMTGLVEWYNRYIEKTPELKKRITLQREPIIEIPPRGIANDDGAKDGFAEKRIYEEHIKRDVNAYVLIDLIWNEPGSEFGYDVDALVKSKQHIMTHILYDCVTDKNRCRLYTNYAGSTKVAEEWVEIYNKKSSSEAAQDEPIVYYRENIDGHRRFDERFYFDFYDAKKAARYERSK